MNRVFVYSSDMICCKCFRYVKKKLFHSKISLLYCCTAFVQISQNLCKIAQNYSTRHSLSHQVVHITYLSCVSKMIDNDNDTLIYILCLTHFIFLKPFYIIIFRNQCRKCSLDWTGLIFYAFLMSWFSPQHGTFVEMTWIKKTFILVIVSNCVPLCMWHNVI